MKTHDIHLDLQLLEWYTKVFMAQNGRWNSGGNVIIESSLTGQKACYLNIWRSQIHCLPLKWRKQTASTMHQPDYHQSKVKFHSTVRHVSLNTNKNCLCKRTKSQEKGYGTDYNFIRVPVGFQLKFLREHSILK